MDNELNYRVANMAELEAKWDKNIAFVSKLPSIRGYIHWGRYNYTMLTNTKK